MIEAAPKPAKRRTCLYLRKTAWQSGGSLPVYCWVPSPQRRRLAVCLNCLVATVITSHAQSGFKPGKQTPRLVVRVKPESGSGFYVDHTQVNVTGASSEKRREKAGGD